MRIDEERLGERSSCDFRSVASLWNDLSMLLTTRMPTARRKTLFKLAQDYQDLLRKSVADE